MSSPGRPVPSFVFLRLPSKFPSQNISPWLTPGFLPVERPWLAGIHVQIGPKSLNWNLAWECFRACVCTNRYEWVHALMHMCACMNVQSNWGLPAMLRLLCELSILPVFPISLSLPARDDTVRCRRKPPPLKGVSFGRQTLLCLSHLHSPPPPSLLASLLSSVPGQMRKGKPITCSCEINNHSLRCVLQNI